MSVRCEECSYENLPQHRFCGMCGAKLPSAARVEAPAAEKSRPAAPPQAFSRPSLLGLAEDDPTEAERVTYLLEDEPRGHRGQLVVLLVLLVAIVAGGWHWRGEMRAWIANAGKNPKLTQVANSDAAPTTPPVAVPAPSTQMPPVSAGDQAAQSTAAPPQNTPADQVAPPQDSAVTDAAKREPEPQEEPAPDATATATKPALKPAVADLSHKATVRNTSADALETQGEDYLYGHGVPADCEHAGKSLLAAAAQSSAKAQTVLGTMYATGHCVTRDVPVAYRWFAKALHQEPGNARIQQDLNVLWQQMTPEERKIAAP